MLRLRLQKNKAKVQTMNEENNEQNQPTVEPVEHGFSREEYPHLASRLDRFFPNHVKLMERDKTQREAM